MREKIVDLPRLCEAVAAARAAGRKVVFTNGCFDLLHRGHLHVLREAKARGDLLVVGVNSDRSVRGLKGPGRPILSEEERLELIAALEMVDYVVLFDAPDPYDVIAAVRPDVLVKGGDWAESEIVGADIVIGDGGTVCVVPYLKGFSTSEIIARIRS
ncbi:MAG TPA: D-glycero-beta-D-manno-heptose 1-phosphate adenylyltransferase [candidate division Zixibacteria bacterium]|nr:D-glycero-beta-D-manno-heptose 1-phosphate adenylyltransferase [candidate division Zixibacteria bacterium]